MSKDSESKGPKKRIPGPTEDQIKELAGLFLGLTNGKPDEKVSIYFFARIFRKVFGAKIKPFQFTARYKLTVSVYGEGTAKTGFYKAGPALRKYFPVETPAPAPVPVETTVAYPDLYQKVLGDREKLEARLTTLDAKMNTLKSDREGVVAELAKLANVEEYLRSS